MNLRDKNTILELLECWADEIRKVNARSQTHDYEGYLRGLRKCYKDLDQLVWPEIYRKKRRKKVVQFASVEEDELLPF